MNEPEQTLTFRNQQVKPSQNDITRFWKRVSKSSPNECWLWTGGKNKGYGLFWFRRTNIPTHRFSWLIHKGPIPSGLCVLHNCPNGDNPSCVNPNHLWLGTDTDNMADRDAKGRQAKGIRNGMNTHPEKRLYGTKNHSAKLDEDDVRVIRIRRNNGEVLRTIAADYNISMHNVFAIASRTIWQQVK